MSNNGIYWLKRKNQVLNTMFISIFFMFFMICIVMKADITFAASSKALFTWWNSIVPSLLPFLIASELLMSLGIVNFLGTLLEPIMRPLFNVPGVGAIPMVMGFVSGNPVGAKLTSRLALEDMCSTIEGERLLCFTSTMNAGFLMGVVAIGIFKSPQIGAILALAHYLSMLLVGVIMRFHKAKLDKKRNRRTINDSKIIIQNAINQFKTSAIGRERLPKLLSESVSSAITSLLSIAGFIVFFSVIASFLESFGAKLIIEKVLVFLGINKEYSMPILHGIFEVSMGAKSTASINVPLENKIILASILFGWSGLSISGQVASMIQRTKINVSPYFVAKVLHAALAGAIAKLLTYLMLPLVTASSINNTGNVQQNFFQTLRMSSSQVVLVTFVLFVSGLVVYFIHTKRPIRKKAKRLSHS